MQNDLIFIPNNWKKEHVLMKVAANLIDFCGIRFIFSLITEVIIEMPLHMQYSFIYLGFDFLRISDAT